MFVPEGSIERYGFRLLFGGVDDRDVAQAVLLSLAHEPEEGFDFFNIMADVPFTSADAPALQHDPTQVLARYYPNATQVFEARHLNPKELIWGRTIWSVDKAKRVLGYRPQYNFDGFLRAVGEGDSEYYPLSGTSWWGV